MIINVKYGDPTTIYAPLLSLPTLPPKSPTGYRDGDGKEAVEEAVGEEANLDLSSTRNSVHLVRIC